MDAVETYDALVIGGGPAGLSAALYLARFDRQVVILDAGQGRSTWHQVAHNYLGFPGGLPTRHLRALGRAQLADYPGVTFVEAKVEALRAVEQGWLAIGQSGTWSGRTLIMATGVVDHYPRFEGWHEYVGRSMFWCITCDGYGSKGKRVVVTGATAAAAAEALQLQRFTPHITLVTDSAREQLDAGTRARLERAGIPLLHDRIVSVEGTEGRLAAICLESGGRLVAEQIFSQQGATPQSQLARDLGLHVNDAGYIMVDADQCTSLPGVFAAGDVTHLHGHQLSTAVHEGGTAACAANYYLYPADLRDD